MALHMLCGLNAVLLASKLEYPCTNVFQEPSEVNKYLLSLEGTSPSVWWWLHLYFWLALFYIRLPVIQTCCVCLWSACLLMQHVNFFFVIQDPFCTELCYPNYFRKMTDSSSNAVYAAPCIIVSCSAIYLFIYLFCFTPFSSLLMQTWDCIFIMEYFWSGIFFFLSFFTKHVSE